MDGSVLTNVLQALALLSGFLLLGTFLRARVRWLQNLFVPASVIGGTVGLLISPSVWGDLTPIAYPADW